METNGKTACIFGANGVSGTAMIEALLKEPASEWKSIIALSRRPLQGADFHNDNRLHSLSADLLETDVDTLSDQLSKVNGHEITHVYFYAYIEKQDEKELVNVNRELLKRALDVIVKTVQAEKNHGSFQSFALQTGYKYYGVHKGALYIASRPFQEDAKRHSGSNFYYDQEDLLKEYATKYNFSYLITRPNGIVGVSKGNYMNAAVSLAIYCCIRQELNESLAFPGAKSIRKCLSDWSTAANNAEFQLWASIHSKNEIFNIHDGTPIKYSELWHAITEYFDPNSKQQDPKKQDECLPITLVEYMKDKRDVWQRLAQKHQLDPMAFDYATWHFVDFVFGRYHYIFGDVTGDLSRARKLGWTKTYSTVNGFYETFDKLKQLNIIPK